MYSFYAWPGPPPPKKCENCRSRLKRTLVFSDTKDGRRNIVMCEQCFREVGAERAFYGMARRYARIKGMWVTGGKPDWQPEDIPDGATLVVTDQLRGMTLTLLYDKSQLG